MEVRRDVQRRPAHPRRTPTGLDPVPLHTCNQTHRRRTHRMQLLLRKPHLIGKPMDIERGIDWLGELRLVLQPQQLGKLQKHRTEGEHTHLKDIRKINQEERLIVLPTQQVQARRGDVARPPTPREALLQRHLIHPVRALDAFLPRLHLELIHKVRNMLPTPLLCALMRLCLVRVHPSSVNPVVGGDGNRG